MTRPAPPPVGRRARCPMRVGYGLASVLLVLAAIVTIAAAHASPGAAAFGDAAGESPATVTTLPPAPGGLNSPLGPRPGEEIPPTSKEDRGGWLQLALMGVILGGVGAIGFLVWRDAQRSRSRAGTRRG